MNKTIKCVKIILAVYIVLFWRRVINWQEINGYTSCNIVYGNNLGKVVSTSSNVNKKSSVSYSNLGHDGADVISNYEIRDDEIFQN